jgi:Ser-tRNA(Ala) deacylase AlaX
MRARAHQAFLAVQSRIDARENAFAAVHLFVQRAHKHEEEVEKAEEAAELAQRAASAAATTKALPVSSSSTASSSPAATSAASPNTSAAVAIPAPMNFTLTFLHPSSVPAASVRSYLRRFSAERMQFHTRRALLYAVLLPVTTLATVLPGPNVFFAAAAYRLLGHYQARQGAEEIIKLLGQDSSSKSSSSSDSGDNAAKGSKPSAETTASGADESLPSVELELQSFELDDTDADACTLEQLCRKLQLDFAAAEATVARWKS